MNAQGSETREKMNQLVDDTRELLAATAHDTEDAVVEARNRVRAALEATGETYDRVKAKAVAGAKVADKTIRQNPYQAIAIALGVGAVLGYVLSRRNRD